MKKTEVFKRIALLQTYEFKEYTSNPTTIQLDIDNKGTLGPEEGDNALKSFHGNNFSGLNCPDDYEFATKTKSHYK